MWGARKPQGFYNTLETFDSIGDRVFLHTESFLSLRITDHRAQNGTRFITSLLNLIIAMINVIDFFITDNKNNNKNDLEILSFSVLKF